VTSGPGLVSRCLHDPKVRRSASLRPRLTTKPDHNRIRREPILADSLKAQAQVSDGIRQTARSLQAGGRWFESP
jgi:hypothetical protein